ncbi:MAG TPA: transporter substrate-binding domain-containing protein, partial [Anaerolineaceae bacterium]|nr:transporter substrate-binding domain-containing protein [Anaerolineaceae bacterium]
MLTVIAVIMVTLGLGVLSVPRQQTPKVIANTTPAVKPSIPPQELVEEETLRIGADQNSPPYAYLIGGRPGGFDIDLISAVAEATGLKVEIHTAPR